MALENNLDLERSIEAISIANSHAQSSKGPLAHPYQYSNPSYFSTSGYSTASNASYSNSTADLLQQGQEQDGVARPVGIHSLKPSLLRYIFGYLAVQHYDYLNHRTHTIYNHLGPVSLVCKTWNAIASPLLWQERTFHGWKAGEELNVFLQQTENADFSSTHEYGEFVRRIEIIDSHDVVDKQNGQFVINWITPDVVLALSEHCSKRLDEGLGAAEMIEFARHCPDLRHLNVSWIESVKPKINDEAVLELTANCLRLEYISLLDANEISDVSFQTLSKLRYLRNLILPRAGTSQSGMAYRQESLVALAKNCKRLEQLHLVAPGATTSRFFEALLYCPHLQVLVIVELSKGLLIDQRFKTLGLAKYVDPESQEGYKLVWHKKT
ncbi:hypothetical protein BGX29_006653 [Mortierella sp. GBA35]|nr:hypothetical protein BGX29_006653 [Mortierella sp. GBA35]